MENASFVKIYLAPLPSSEIGTVRLDARQKEIDGVSNEKVKREKYFVWKLLEYAFNEQFGERAEQALLQKCATGKWVCDLCEFSLSHSGKLLCVALSNAPVGVDIEKIKTPKTDLSKEILSRAEQEVYQTLSTDEKVPFLITAWTKKESLFKKKNLLSLTRDAFREQDGAVFQTTIRLQGESYALSVATDTPDKVTVFYDISL